MWHPTSYCSPESKIDREPFDCQWRRLLRRLLLRLLSKWLVQRGDLRIRICLRIGFVSGILAAQLVLQEEQEMKSGDRPNTATSKIENRNRRESAFRFKSLLFRLANASLWLSVNGSSSVLSLKAKLLLPRQLYYLSEGETSDVDEVMKQGLWQAWNKGGIFDKLQG